MGNHAGAACASGVYGQVTAVRGVAGAEPGSLSREPTALMMHRVHSFGAALCALLSAPHPVPVGHHGPRSIRLRSVQGRAARAASGGVAARAGAAHPAPDVKTRPPPAHCRLRRT